MHLKLYFTTLQFTSYSCYGEEGRRNNGILSYKQVKKIKLQCF